MSQTGYSKVQIYSSSTASNTPSASNLTNDTNGSELGINITDGKLFYKDNSGTVQVMATKGTGPIGGSNTQVQYNSSGALAGSANMTFNGTTLTLANDATVHGLTVGLGGGSVAGNVAVGDNAGLSNTTGGANTFIGSSAGRATTSANNNTALGYAALFSNTTGASNTAIGSGINGTANGALGSNTTGGSNTAIGVQSLFSNTTASNNTAVGYQAGYSQTTGGTSAGYNAYFGQSAGYASTGYQNTLIGRNSGSAITSGNSNTLIGQYNGNQGGLDIRTSNNYIVLSDGDGNPRGYYSSSANGWVFPAASSSATPVQTVGASGDAAYQAILITKYDNNSTTSQNFIQFQINNGGVNSGKITANGANQATFTSTSDVTLKTNIVPLASQLANINAIEVIEFDYIESEGGGHQIGFSAQNMQTIYPDTVSTREDGKLELSGWNKTEARLVKAIQELSALVTAQATEIAALKAKVGI